MTRPPHDPAARWTIVELPHRVVVVDTLRWAGAGSEAEAEVARFDTTAVPLGDALDFAAAVKRLLAERAR